MKLIRVLALKEQDYFKLKELGRWYQVQDKVISPKTGKQYVVAESQSTLYTFPAEKLVLPQKQY